MAQEQEKAPAGQAAQAETQTTSLLDQVVSVTPQAARDGMKEMVGVLVDQAMKGVVKWDRNVSRTLDKGIAAIDAAISKQLAAIMHTPEFQKLEGTWRGFKHLVFNSETSSTLRIKVMNVAKKDLYKD